MMGKIKDTIHTGVLRVGNTIATPVRWGGEIGNAMVNILRQGQSSVKNTAEVTKQTIDALVHNFTHFSKVEGKRYQKLIKGTINLASAVTRRPVMIAGAGIASGINQGFRKPFQKLLYTPGKMFKGIGNATRIFSKKKGFDFVQYDTHETGKDTRVNQIKEKNRGFLGVKKGNSEVIKEKKIENVIKEEKKEENKKEEKKPQITTSEKIQKAEEKKVEKKAEEKRREEKDNQEQSSKHIKIENQEEKLSKKVSESAKKEDTSKQPEQSISSKQPTSFDELEKKHLQEVEEKHAAEQAKKFPAWKDIDEESKKEYIKDYEKVLGGKVDEKKIIERGKKHKKGETIDEILLTVKKENPTMAGYFEEILAKKTPASA